MLVIGFVFTFVIFSIFWGRPDSRDPGLEGVVTHKLSFAEVNARTASPNEGRFANI